MRAPYPFLAVHWASEQQAGASEPRGAGVQLVPPNLAETRVVHDRGRAPFRGVADAPVPDPHEALWGNGGVSEQRVLYPDEIKRMYGLDSEGLQLIKQDSERACACACARSRIDWWLCPQTTTPMITQDPAS
jgi:hypothetical protein